LPPGPGGDFALLKERALRTGRLRRSGMRLVGGDFE